MKTGKRWVIAFLIVYGAAMLFLGGLTVWIDPYFHYHKMLPFLQYPMDDERYQNNGIIRNFDYDAIITGSSMTECFKTSELDALFGVKSVKVPYSGGSFKEVGDLLKDAERYNDHIRMVVRCLDYYRTLEDKDHTDYGADMYPTYLYDDVWYNDVKYVLNKQVLLKRTWDVIGYTRSGKKTPSFDEYMNWSMAGWYQFGEDAIKEEYEPWTVNPPDEPVPITEEDYETIRGNITQNITDIADANPDTEFYYYFSPYSIYFFDYYNREKLLDRFLKAEKYTIELMLEHENIHLYSFFLNEELICNPDNYRDVAHQHEDVNSQILIWMKEGTGELTKENYEAYCAAEREFFENYDYDALFTDWEWGISAQ